MPTLAANTKIQIKRTAVSGRTPNTTNSANSAYIDPGELAINLADKKVYTSNGSAYFEVGSNVSTLTVQSIIANSALGNPGEVLATDGANVYWTNAVGPIGYTGSQGVAGYTGSQGSSGYAGSKGDQGYTGSQGNQGNTGYTGSQGDAGYTGSAGINGYTGSTGIQGDAGYTGSQGALGYTGSKGTTYTGNTAPISPVDGDTWWNSTTGVRYVYYVDSDSAQWVQETSVGPKGADGTIGVDGYTGSQGIQGYTGSKGDTGDVTPEAAALLDEARTIQNLILMGI